MNTYYVYMMTNYHHTTLYVGVTNNLSRRVAEHQSGLIDGFTKSYSLSVLVYFEEFGDVNDAIHREKQLKGWSRAKKNALVDSLNPHWKDLSQE